jgi:type IV secretory pathway VirJ component
MPGGHYFGGGYSELAAVILGRLPVLSARVLAP